MTDVGDRTRVVVYYAIWATICAAAAGIAMALIHAAFFSYNPGRPTLLHTLFGNMVTALALAAGQGAVALVTGSVLVRFERALQATVLLGLLIGAFDFVMYFVQTAIPATELGWVPDLIILVVATALITALGARRTAAPAGP
jgi:hypothetical protein